MESGIQVELLRDRAAMLQAARLFFSKRDVIEVDCPALSQAAPIDLHIDVMSVALKGDRTGYLHTSPEYGMKRLLATGIGDIYQISHVFRDGEIGPLHNPEFTMAEWYRIGFSFAQMITETLDFIRLFLGELPAQEITYRAALQKHLGIDYLAATPLSLYQKAERLGLSLPQDAATWDRDTLLQLLVSFVIEPRLGQNQLSVLSYFPSTQAALSRITHLEGGEAVACRFEVYYQGIELANGYHELTDATEQQVRFEASNRARAAAGKEILPIDRHLLAALERGLPDCCGVAVGFDRLMQLRHRQATLATVLPISWEMA